MCLDVICPRWSLHLAQRAALMSWCTSWPQIRCAGNQLCAGVQQGLWGGAAGQTGKPSPHFLPVHSAETSVCPDCGFSAERGKIRNGQ